jgi:hypothetical protein
LEISLRWRSRVRSSIDQSVSLDARSVRSASRSESVWSWFSVPAASRKIASFHCQQLLAEIFLLPRIHERFVVARADSRRRRRSPLEEDVSRVRRSRSKTVAIPTLHTGHPVAKPLDDCLLPGRPILAPGRIDKRAVMTADLSNPR